MAERIYHGPCAEIIHGGTGLQIGDWHPCGAPGEGVQLDTAADGTPLASIGRRTVDGHPRCPLHGGLAASRERALRDWSYLAPASVGHDGQVQTAGCLALTTPDAIVVIRREEPEQTPERWEVRVSRAQADRICDRPGYAAARSICGPSQWFATQAEAERRAARLAELDPESERPPVTRHDARSRRRPRPWLAQIGVGSFLRHVAACASHEEALAAAREAWTRQVASSVAAITAARGGTLSWGLPVRPRTEPIVVEPAARECSWDAYTRTERTVPVSGIECMTGAHPDGSGL